jgi:hypothetical protein
MEGKLRPLRGRDRARAALVTPTLAICLITASLANGGAPAASVGDDGAGSWRALGAGVEYGSFLLERPLPIGDGRLHVVRIDATRAQLHAHLASEPGERPRTAREWCASKSLLAAINLGMFGADHRTNVGYARKGGHLNNSRFNSYRSVLAFGPRQPDLPPAQMLDVESAEALGALASYDTVVQNLRLIRRPGQNVWAPQAKRWSEAAVGIDEKGRLLFLFTRTPFAMRELNQALLALPLGIQAAMHVEGGPEASLSIHALVLTLDLNGSYETGFTEHDASAVQWPIPNVLGVTVRPPSGPAR